MKKEQHYTVAELIHDDSFRRMVNGTATSEEVEHWSRWIEKTDANRETAKQAMAEITGFTFKNSLDSEADEEWKRLYERTIGNTVSQPRHTTSVQKNRAEHWILRIAAVLLLAGTVGVGFYLYEGNEKNTELQQITRQETVTTEANQQKTLTFTNGPKEAKIVLNGNSSLTYSLGLLKDQPVQVNLEGEAFFDVEEGFSDSPAFSVTTPDGVIEDIGTEFLVTVWDDRSRVILQDGLVKIRAGDGDQPKEEFQLARGEMVEFQKSEILSRTSVNSTLYTSWATGFMEFDNTSISTFAEYIEQRFDVTVKVDHEELNSISLDGAVYFKSLEELVRSVSDITSMQVYQSQNRDTVYIGEIHEVKNQ